MRWHAASNSTVWFLRLQPVVSVTDCYHCVVGDDRVDVPTLQGRCLTGRLDLPQELFEPISVEEVQADAFVVAHPSVTQQPIQLLFADFPVLDPLFCMSGQMHVTGLIPRWLA